MGFGYPLVSSARYETQGLATGVGVTVTPSSTANTNGSYAAVGGITGFEYDGFFVAITGNSGGGGTRYLVDIAAQNTAQEIVAANLFFDPEAAGIYSGDNQHVYIPVKVKKGATLYARCSSVSGAGTVSVSTLGYAGDGRMLSGFSKQICATDITGGDPANSITLSGATLTGWTQIQASTPNRLAALMIRLDDLGAALGTASPAMFEIGMGVSGSEVSLGIKFATMLGGAFGLARSDWFACNIPAGKRLAARAQCANADTNSLGLFLYGLVG
jgi:hypothetical protein